MEFLRTLFFHLRPHLRTLSLALRFHVRNVISTLCFRLCLAVHFLIPHHNMHGLKLMRIPRVQHTLKVLQRNTHFLMVFHWTPTNGHVRRRFHKVPLLFSLGCF